MSWLDRLNNIELAITTGEGSVFTPLFKNASRSRNMNASVFNFNNIQGSFVPRGKAESMRYPFELHFTGDDHIDEAERFNQASLDVRPWRITHPNYGDVLVQPISINFNDSSQNDTIVTTELFETIEDTYPESTIEVKEEVLSDVESSIDSQVNAFNIESPSTKLGATASTATNNLSVTLKARSITDIDLQTVQNRSNEALQALNNITSDPLDYMRKAAELARTPSKFYSKVQDRLDVLKEAYDELKTVVNSNSSAQEKILFESLAGSLVSSMAETSVLETQSIADDQFIENNTLVDYNTRNDVILVAEFIKAQLNDYLTTLGEYQSEVDATPDSYTPQQDSINAAKKAINTATGQLLQLAVQARQERQYTLFEPTAIIILVHRLLGTYEDSKVQSFVDNNEILLDEGLLIPQGRIIKYFI